MTTYLVAVYLVDRCYGGPEEGGWWYTKGRIARTVKVTKSEEAAYAYARRLNEKLNSRRFGPNADRRSISSVLSEGIFDARVYENAAPKEFPEEAPYYC